MNVIVGDEVSTCNPYSVQLTWSSPENVMYVYTGAHDPRRGLGASNFRAADVICDVERAFKFHLGCKP